MEDACDLMLPYWWIVKHKAKEFAEGRKISFENEQCKRTCTKHNGNSFTIEIHDTILYFGNEPGWFGIIGNPKISNNDEMEIDWIDMIP